MTLSESERLDAARLQGTFLTDYKSYRSTDLATFQAQTPSCALGRLKHDGDAGCGGRQYWLTEDGQVRLFVNGYSGEIEGVDFT